MFREFLKAFLTYQRSERRGFAVILLLLVAVIGLNVHLRISGPRSATAQLIAFGPSIARFNASLPPFGADTHAFAHPRPWDAKRAHPHGRTPERFPFNPNTLDSAGWVRLGFSPRQSASILKYRSRGGTFRKKEDLLKLFMVDSALYLELQPFVTIPPTDETAPQRAFAPRYERPALPIVDINRADTLEMENIRGIGTTFARRIYRYRERLGGFRTMAQLLEVFGMDSARFQGMLPQLTIDTTVRTRININTADYTALIRHPYLQKNQVRAIIAYRQQHGPFRSVSDLRNIHIIKEEDLQRLGPYLTVH